MAVWRLSSLVAKEDGPFDIFLRFRKWAGTESSFSRGLVCIWCNSVWFSAVIALPGAISGLFVWWLYPVVVLALSTGAIIVEQFIVWLMSNSFKE
jgi:hypothetical protein